MFRSSSRGTGRIAPGFIAPSVALLGGVALAFAPSAGLAVSAAPAHSAPTKSSSSVHSAAAPDDLQLPPGATKHVEYFGCSQTKLSITIPADVGLIHLSALGGHGGTPGSDISPHHGGDGGAGTIAEAYFGVHPGDVVQVATGCWGADHGGWGGAGMNGGDRGGAPSPDGYDGAGGGGASVAWLNGEIVLVGGGGGGGGGYFGSDRSGSQGGEGRDAGASGSSGHDNGGGCSGCRSENTGGHGGTADGGQYAGGGGGGGGGGWSGGDGGHAFSGGGGGGGAGGSYVSSTSLFGGTGGIGPDDATGGTIALITYTGTTTALTAVSGSDQTAKLGSTFPKPLSVKATDIAGNPVKGATVSFFADGDPGAPQGVFPNGTWHTSVVTDAAGIATSPPLKATGGTGTWKPYAWTAVVNPGPSFTLINDPADQTTPVPTTTPTSGTNPPPAAGSHTERNGELANTGSDVPAWPGAGALALLVAGAALAFGCAAEQRRRDTRE